MLAVLLLAAQAAVDESGSAEALVDAISRRVNERCAPSDASEIIVCGRRPEPDRHRLRPLRLPEGIEPPGDGRLRFRLGEADGEVEATQHVRQDGLVDQRIMVHIRVPF